MRSQQIFVGNLGSVLFFFGLGMSGGRGAQISGTRYILTPAGHERPQAAHLHTYPCPSLCHVASHVAEHLVHVVLRHRGMQCRGRCHARPTMMIAAVVSSFCESAKSYAAELQACSEIAHLKFPGSFQVGDNVAFPPDG